MNEKYITISKTVELYQVTRTQLWKMRSKEIIRDKGNKGSDKLLYLSDVEKNLILRKLIKQ